MGRSVFSFTFTFCLLPFPFASAQPPPAPPAAVSEPTATAATEKISLDLKGVDILDVLKLLSQKSGLNFVAGRNVTGRVTIFAKDVGIWDAFERIISANDLAYEQQAGLINVMTSRDYEQLYGETFQERKRHLAIPLKYAKAEQLATVLNQVKSKVGQVLADEPSNTLILQDVPSQLEEMRQLVVQLDRPTMTKVFNLNYADAEKLKEKVQELLTVGVGQFRFDARTNKVIVTDLAEVLPKIATVINAFDEPEGEVQIDARLVKVALSDVHSMGVDWQQVFGSLDMDVRTNFRVLTGEILGGDTNTNRGGALKFSSGFGSTKIVLEALNTFGKVETISNPRITVSNNQEAKILVGKKEAFVTVTTTVPATGSTVTSPEIQFVDVGTKLSVTPSVKRDGYIQMKIHPEVSTATVETFQTNRIPIVSTTDAETNVLVKSGSTLIIGGLMETTDDNSENRLPVLGDLPLIGLAFRHISHTKKKTELVVFLTPQIVSGKGENVTAFLSSAPPQEVFDAVMEAAMRHANPVPTGYQTQVRRQAQEALWKAFQARVLSPGSVALTFVVDKAGHLVGLPEVRSSDGDALVEAARTALSGETFPAFPENITATQVRFRLVVDYQPSAAPGAEKPVAATSEE